MFDPTSGGEETNARGHRRKQQDNKLVTDDGITDRGMYEYFWFLLATIYEVPYDNGVGDNSPSATRL